MLEINVKNPTQIARETFWFINLFMVQRKEGQTRATNA
jgi:hypothetical protein